MSTPGVPAGTPFFILHLLLHLYPETASRIISRLPDVQMWKEERKAWVSFAAKSGQIGQNGQNDHLHLERGYKG
jgi:hypothetical protein